MARRSHSSAPNSKNGEETGDSQRITSTEEQSLLSADLSGGSRHFFVENPMMPDGQYQRLALAKQATDAERLALREVIDQMRAGNRLAAADFIEKYGPLIRRRVRGKLSTQLRRLCDSTDLLSTIRRRLDSYVLNKRITLTEIPQLWSLVNKIADAAVIDKLRALERLRRAERDDSELACLVEKRAFQRGVAPEEELASVIENAISELPSRDDREIIVLWSHDVPLSRIATQIGRSQAAVRQRWMIIRRQLRKSLEAEYY